MSDHEDQPQPETAAPVTFDFASLDTTATSDKGRKMLLEHPVTGEPLGVGAFIVLAGADSSAYRKAQSVISKRRVKKRLDKITAEDMRAESVEMLARCSLSWGNIIVDGQEWSCSVETAKAFFTRFPWAYEQADRFVHDRSNYLQDLQ